MYGDKGTDIVCAAVSALTQTCVLGLEEVLKLDPQVNCSEKDGITCILNPEGEPDALAGALVLLKTLNTGLEAILDAYPGTLKIRTREV